jgi:hypothetical protein
MLHVQEYLRKHGIEKLEEEFGIQVVRYDDRITLNYSQTDSPKHSDIVKECRGLILSLPDFEIMCRSFDRFFNYGEDPNSKDFNIKKATAWEKVDGSICNVYHDGNKWQVATRKMAFAEGLVPAQDKTYRDVFIEALGNDPDEVFKPIHKDLVIIFELVSPQTRIVKPYKKTEVYLLDVRDKHMGKYVGLEISYFWDIPEGTKWKYPKKYHFNNFEDIMQSVKDLPVMEEGYVLSISKNSKVECGSNIWRIKVKNPAYLAIANLRMNGVLSEKRVALLVCMQDHEEYLYYFPEDRERFEPFIKAYEEMLGDIEAKWEMNKDIEDQKEFALAIKDCPASSILFSLRKKQSSIGELIDRMNDNYKYNLLKSYTKEE